MIYGRGAGKGFLRAARVNASGFLLKCEGGDAVAAAT